MKYIMRKYCDTGSQNWEKDTIIYAENDDDAIEQARHMKRKDAACSSYELYNSAFEIVDWC